jgi:hypothetical protein
VRRFLILTLVFIVGAVGWVLLDADPEGRQELVDRITDAFSGNNDPPPNWGDVATKVGEFTEGERELRDVLNPAMATEPAPAE